MTSGPPRTPEPLLRLRGSELAKKRSKTTPKAPSGRPVRPAWLTGEGRKHWERTVPLLEKMGVLSSIDRGALARYCDHWQQWLVAREWIMDKGTTYPLYDKMGNVTCFMPWPAVAQYNKLSTQLLRIEQEFGLTPAARSRIIVNTGGGGAKPSGLVNRGGGAA